MIGFNGGFNTGFIIIEAKNFGFQDWFDLYISSKTIVKTRSLKVFKFQYWILLLQKVVILDVIFL